MAVYKVLVQKFNGDKETPFQTDTIEVCATRFRVTDEGALLLLDDAVPPQYAAAFSCGTWYRVQKLALSNEGTYSDGTESMEACECGCE